jgi:hypothetical protein
MYWLKYLVVIVIEYFINLAKGAWFIVFSPIEFNEFLTEWRRFKDHIRDNDERLQSAAMMGLNLRQRRRLGIR